MVDAKKRSWAVFAKGAPGRSARITGVKIAGKYLFLGLLLFAVAELILFFADRKLAFGMVIGACIMWGFKSIGRKIDLIEGTWIEGAVGEGRTAKALSHLPTKDFRLINDLPNGRGNIDHVVVGRTGIFLIETKNWGGRIHYKNGKLCKDGLELNPDPLKQVRRQAAIIAHKTEAVLGRRPYIMPVLCFINSWIDDKALCVENVTLSRPRFLSRVITRRKLELSQTEVAAVAGALEMLRKPKAADLPEARSRLVKQPADQVGFSPPGLG